MNEIVLKYIKNKYDEIKNNTIHCRLPTDQEKELDSIIQDLMVVCYNQDTEIEKLVEELSDLQNRYSDLEDQINSLFSKYVDKQ